LWSKSISYFDGEDFAQLASNLLPEYDYIFYISPEGVEMEDNGVRETDLKYRNLIDFTIQNIISKYKHRIKQLHTIEGTTEERIKQVKEALSL
jgi:hypothetical protein